LGVDYRTRRGSRPGLPISHFSLSAVPGYLLKNFAAICGEPFPLPENRAFLTQKRAPF
jgi:hypothetical protein